MKPTERHWATTAALLGALAVFLYMILTSWRGDTATLIFCLSYLTCASITHWLLVKPILNPWLKKLGVRICLLTAIVLMFAAGCIVWLNVDQSFGEVWYSTGGGSIGIRADRQGWPMTFRIQTSAYPNLEIPSIILTNMLVDLFVGISILVLVAVICEWVVRRRAVTRKTMP